MNIQTLCEWVLVKWKERIKFEQGNAKIITMRVHGHAAAEFANRNYSATEMLDFPLWRSPDGTFVRAHQICIVLLVIHNHMVWWID